MFVSWHDGHISVFPQRPHLSIVGFSLSLEISIHFLTPSLSLSCLSFLREPCQRSPSLLCRATLPVFPLSSPCFFLCVVDLVLATQALYLCSTCVLLPS
ncbi:hypothetical protein PRUPE_4G274200 [Prunus persica]|uniref:Uncharacterized protein n=1 Tax=Prunus persica TaxID=3760 RepID=A0A251PV26_PRUPE|nr:hypothetical protein PRUPE_4G274200 [Prunus persica]